jgi:hypothetical protein
MGMEKDGRIFTAVVKLLPRKKETAHACFCSMVVLFVWPQAFPINGLGFVGPNYNDPLFFDPALHHMKEGKTNSNNFPKKYDFWNLVHIGFCSSFMWW